MHTDPRGFQNPHSRSNKVGRALWNLVWRVLFRWSPRRCYGWRNWLLRRFGATIGDAQIDPKVEIWAPWLLRVGSEGYITDEVILYNAYGVTIGDRVVISRGSMLCSASHDYRDPRYKLIGGPIIVEDDCWIAAEAFILPGVTIGAGAVVGARSVAPRDVPPWTVVAGNPAQVICPREMRDSRP
jgi:putative colanic acid biosynthesis acetyltransferase WcaF